MYRYICIMIKNACIYRYRCRYRYRYRYTHRGGALSDAYQRVSSWGLASIRPAPGHDPTTKPHALTKRSNLDSSHTWMLAPKLVHFKLQRVEFDPLQRRIHNRKSTMWSNRGGSCRGARYCSAPGLPLWGNACSCHGISPLKPITVVEYAHTQGFKSRLAKVNSPINPSTHPLLSRRRGCPPRQKSRVERLKANVEPLLT